MKNISIFPGLLESSLESLKPKLTSLINLKPKPSVVQVDIIDGEYHPNLTIEPNAVRELDWQGIDVDLHLLVVEPIDYISEVADFKSLRTVIGQIERMSSQTEFVAEAEAGGVAAGLSLDIFTPFESLETSILSKLNVIQIMGGQLGEQGNPFNPLALEKIKLASGYRQSHNLSYEICVDVGMNPQTIPQVKLAGADAFVVGSYLFNQAEGDNLSFQNTNYQTAWDQLLSAVKG